MTYKKTRLSFILFPITLLTVPPFLLYSGPSNADPQMAMDYLGSLSLDELMNVSVETASGIEEELNKAPASMVVITAKDIEERGYGSLDEIFNDLPGFDTIQHGGEGHITTYQRGYRTPFTQRTLLMIDGIVDNEMWLHLAMLSRQYPLTHIERIEVLYGPSSAIYGPNAFLGIVNIVTKKATTPNQHETRFSGQIGSFKSRALEISTYGQQKDFKYSLSAKFFKSDEAQLDDFPQLWGYNTEKWLNNRYVWGSLLDLQQEGVQLGEYHDPTEDWSLLGQLSYRNFTLGWIAWQIHEGFGVYYPADRVQPGLLWKMSSYQTYLQHQGTMASGLHLETLFLYRQNHTWGKWAEAFPDSTEGKEEYSYLSLSNWNTPNESWLFKQDADYQVNDTFRLTFGLKYEIKTLAKSVDVCSYWSEASCSTADPNDQGPYGFGNGIFYSTDPVVLIKPGPDDYPEENTIDTKDWGGYVQGIMDFDKWRIHAGVRYDHNNIYGHVINPRGSLIYQYAPDTTMKLIYGTAFQEPAPIQLWGGWSGRQANPNLRPEKASNLEFVMMYKQEHWLHDVSLFNAHYRDVIKEEAENAGKRDIYGLEYRGRYSFPNFLHGAQDITGYLYYTFTRSRSSIYFDPITRKWLEGEANLGDIAPHKINLGFNLPFNSHWHMNLRANYVSEHELYLRNPLRFNGDKAQAYTLFHLSLGYKNKAFSMAFKVNNLFDKGYFQPGLEQADSGDNFEERSVGFRNSLIPQIGRSLWLSLGWEF